MISELQGRAYRFLRWSERYTGTDMVYLAHGGFWLFLKTGLMMLTALALSVAFANLLPPATYGEYKYIFSIFSFLAAFTLLGMGTSVTKSVAQGFEGTPTAALKSKLRWGLIGSFGAVCVALYYFFQGNIRLAESFALVAAFLPFVDTLGVFNSVLTGKRLFKVSTFCEIFIQAVSVAIIITALYLTDDLFIILTCYFVSYTTLRAFVFRFVIKWYTDNDKIDPAAILYGKHLSVMEILAIAAETTETMLLWQFLGPAPIAVYAFAKGIPAQMSAALQRLTTLAFPKFAASECESFKRPLIKKMLKLFVIMACIVLAYVIAAPYIFALLFPKYMESVLYSQLFALTLLFFPQKFIGTAFQAHAHTSALYTTSIVVPIARILLALLLIPTYGILGALMAELSTRAVNLTLVSILFARTHR